MIRKEFNHNKIEFFFECQYKLIIYFQKEIFGSKVRNCLKKLKIKIMNLIVMNNLLFINKLYFI